MISLNLNNVKIVKKNGNLQNFDINKVLKAVNKSANRILVKFSEEDVERFSRLIIQKVADYCADCETSEIPVRAMHSIVEMSLDEINPEIAKSYREYRDIIKNKFANMMDKVYQRNKEIMFRGDQENANADSALVSTKRALCYNVLNKEMYQKFFLTAEENQACDEGYIYVHKKFVA